MADVQLEHIYKVYENGVKAVNDFSIDIKDKEFIVFVGPSGCGKSTTLRMIAGLEEITTGDLYIGNERVNEVEPKDRDIAFVFQNYALYPHMTVYNNMAYGLRNRNVEKTIVDERVKKAAAILGIEEYLNRKPKEMSGGQRQRVALGRAIVRNPKVFLLDEPLSNLDAKLRSQMRTEIIKLHQNLNTTFIYVTHDQVEAMTMGTRIVVMKDGYIQQIDSPINLYNKPKNKFVAGFIGTPQMNFLNCKLKKENNIIQLNILNYISSFSYDNVKKINVEYLDGEKEIIIGCRPDNVIINKNNKGIPCIVSVIEQLGGESILYAYIENTSTQIVAKIPPTVNYELNSKIYITFDFTKTHFFDVESEKTLIEDIPSFNDITVSIDNNSLELLGKNIILPPAFENLLKNQQYKFLIPPEAIIEGNDFSLPIVNIEKYNEQYLLEFDLKGQSVFFLTNKQFNKGELFDFSLLFEKITIMDNNDVVFKGFEDQEFIECEIAVRKELSEMTTKDGQTKTKKINKLFYKINDNYYLIPQEKAKKIGLVEGRQCLKKTYLLALNRNCFTISDCGIKVNVDSILDFKHHKYAKILLNNNNTIYVEINDDIASGFAHLSFKYDKFEVYKIDNNVRIC